MKTHQQDLGKTPAGIHLTLPLLPDLNIQRRTIGRKDLPLNDSLVNTVTYYVRG